MSGANQNSMLAASLTTAGNRGAGAIAQDQRKPNRTERRAPASVPSRAGTCGVQRRARLTHNWRGRLPDPASYYAGSIPTLGRPNAQGWAQGQCPFHEYRDASLSVQTQSGWGGWRCFAGCGKGDLVSFHQRRIGKEFADAVLDLLRGGA